MNAFEGSVLLIGYGNPGRLDDGLGTGAWPKPPPDWRLAGLRSSRAINWLWNMPRKWQILMW